MSPRTSETPHRKLFAAAFDAHDWKTLSERLRSAGYEVTMASSADAFVREAAELAPDLVIIDRAGPGVPEAHLRDRLGDTPTMSTTPVLVLQSSGDSEIETPQTPGRLDTLRRPFSSAEFVARVKAMIRVAYCEDDGPPEKTRDGLTKLYNRFYFDERLQKEIERARRYGRDLSVVLMDVDGLDNINDSFSHKVGDSVLRSLADILLSGTRLSDIIARFGGDEFALILPETGANEAGILSERLRTTFSERMIATGKGGEVMSTVTCGIACYPDHAGDVPTLLRMADSALCQARKEGRNRTVVAFSDSGKPSWGELATNPTILLVEQNAYNRSVASVVLRANGYEVIEASDGVTALALAKSSHPDLVIMDVNLGAVDGLSVAREILGTDETRNIPVVALTASDMPRELERLVSAGCCGYITKPIDTNSLASQIEPYIAR